LGPPLYLALAGALGLSQSALRQALMNGTFAPKVRKDFLGGARSGVNGTPSFFINGRRHDGTYAFEDLVAAIGMHLRAPWRRCDRRAQPSRVTSMQPSNSWSWMWTDACAQVERAERLHRQFFHPGSAAGWQPPIDVFETDEEQWIMAALPGVER
jgi:hypothetical protein